MINSQLIVNNKNERSLERQKKSKKMVKRGKRETFTSGISFIALAMK
jgi:hypothetical protein